MTIILKLIGGALSLGRGLIEQYLAHWRITVPLTIVALLVWQNHNLKADLHTAQQEHYNYIAQVSIDASARQATLVEQARQADIMMATTSTVHLKTIKHLKELNNEQLKAQALPLNRTITDLRNRLRDSIAAHAAERLSDYSQYPGGFAGRGGDGDPADIGERCQTLERYYSNLELGCAVTTADYNTLAARSRRLCEIFPCKGVLNE